MGRLDPARGALDRLSDPARLSIPPRVPVLQYDIKNRRIFLKKVVYPPVKEKDLYIGSTITVYSRQLKVVDFADEYTKNTITQTQQM